MRISFFRHASILSGTGVGGGSLVYANTLPLPRGNFFNTGSWEDLADWKKELDRNYLWLAQKHGTEIISENEVIDVKPSGSQDGSDGYIVTDLAIM